MTSGVIFGQEEPMPRRYLRSGLHEAGGGVSHGQQQLACEQNDFLGGKRTKEIDAELPLR